MIKKLYFKQFNISNLFAFSLHLEGVLFDLQYDPIRYNPEPGDDSNEGVLCIPQSSSTIKLLMSYPGYSLEVRVLFLCRDAVGIFYIISRLGCCSCVHTAI